MTEIFLAPFDYDVLRAGRDGRAGTTALRRAAAAFEIPAVQSSDLAVAYRVEHRRDLGPGRHLILRHEDELWWPLVDTTFPLETRTARDFLRELRAGRSDLFVRRGLDHLFLEPRRQRQVIHDGHDDALAAVCRNARNLLIVDDGLYAAGGAPLLVDAFGRISIASTGADRAVAVPSGALRIKPANGHRKAIDLAICGGRLYTPGSVYLKIAMERRPFKFHGVRIRVLDGDPIDPLVVRIDAAFSAAWTAMNRSIPRTRPEGWDTLRDQFVEACGVAEDHGLTHARYRLLQRFIELFERAEQKPVAVSECLYNVQRTVSAAADSPCVLPPELSPTEDEAVACLV